MREARFIDFDNDFEEEQSAAASLGLSQDDIVIKQYKVGMTVKAIVADNGISYGKVYEILSRNGVPLRSGRYNNTKSGERILTMGELEKRSLINDYLAGMQLKALFEKYEINKHGCYLILDAANIPRRHLHIKSEEEDIVEIMPPIELIADPAPTQFMVDEAPIVVRREGDTLYINISTDKVSVEPISIVISFNLGE